MKKTILVTFQLFIGIIIFGQENNTESKSLRNTVFVEAFNDFNTGKFGYLED